MSRVVVFRIARRLARVGAGVLCAVWLASPLGCASDHASEPVAVTAPAPEEAPAPPEQAPPAPGDGGWGYLVDKLVADGVPRERVLHTFQDPRFDAFDGLPFGLDPKESRALYRNFLKQRSVQLARQCRVEHAGAFEYAERTQKVPASVIAAILYVETGCGQNTGDSVVLYRLARLAMANEPQNLEMNLERNATVKGVRNDVLALRTRERARYLEDLFYPEVLATFTIAERQKLDPLDIRGSGSGAFGYPQFLPTSYLRYGVDGNGDGVVSLYNADDAAASAGRYLSEYGWHAGLSDAEKRRVIWHYNRSDAYIETVLGLAARIEGPAKTTAPKQKLAASKKPKAKKTTTATAKAQKPATETAKANKAAPVTAKTVADATDDAAAR
jgi:membrane-bound lytic murein transglycosylase B